MFVFQHAVPAAGIPEVSGEETMQAQRELGSESGKPDNKVVKSYNLTFFFMHISYISEKTENLRLQACLLVSHSPKRLMLARRARTCSRY